MTQLYSREKMLKLKKANKLWAAVAAAAALGGLIACIVMCCLTTTGNAAAMEGTAILTSMLTGWAAIFLYLNVVDYGRREWKHTQLILDSTETETLTGTVKISPKVFEIKGSVTVYNVTLDDGKEKHLLAVEYRRGKQLKKAGERLKVETAGGYITAFEAVGDANA